jgi:hypothetical protein
MCEICEFAARLALSNAGDAEICMEIGVHGIQNRQLWVDETRRTGFSVPRESEIPVYSVERQISREQLVGTAQEHGLEEAQKLFALFGWDVGKDVLRDTLRQ